MALHLPFPSLVVSGDAEGVRTDAGQPQPVTAPCCLSNIPLPILPAPLRSSLPLISPQLIVPVCHRMMTQARLWAGTPACMERAAINAAAPHTHSCDTRHVSLIPKVREEQPVQPAPSGMSCPCTASTIGDVPAVHPNGSDQGEARRDASLQLQFTSSLTASLQRSFFFNWSPN